MPLAKYIPSYTLEDYRSWKGDWELWSGIPIAMTPSLNKTHQRLAGKLFSQIKSSLAESDCAGCELFYELDWIVSQDTVFRPDLMVVCDDRAEDFVETTPELVVEILSESTRRRDLLFKRESYETVGVKYYLIVDPAARSYTLLENTATGYQSTEEQVLRIKGSCQLELTLDELFS